MNHNHPSPLGANEHPIPQTGRVYAQAQEKARTMQYGIRSGRPDREHKSSTSEDESGEEDRAGAESTGSSSGIKKPRPSHYGGQTDGQHTLPVTEIGLAVTWIPGDARSGGVWTKTITVKDLFRQLRRQKVKLLVDLDDESSLTMEEDVISNGDINM